MTRKFGWCFSPVRGQIDHESCPGQIGGPSGITCSCDCHDEETSA